MEQRRETDRRFQQVEDQIAALTRTVDTLRDDVGELKGDSLERRYREKASAYFGRVLRRTRVVTDDELSDLLDDAVERGVLKLGYTTLPVVGGKAVTREAAELAREQGVWQLFDGRLVAPDEDAEAG